MSSMTEGISTTSFTSPQGEANEMTGDIEMGPLANRAGNRQNHEQVNQPDQSQNQSISIWNQFIHYKILAVIPFKILLVLCNTLAALLLGIFLCEDGYTNFGVITIIIIFIPFFVKLLESLLERLGSQMDPQEPNYFSATKHLPFVLLFRSPRYIVWVATMDRSNPHNFELMSNLNSMVFSYIYYETFTGSAPLLLWQIYIHFTLGPIYLYQEICIFLCICSLFESVITQTIVLSDNIWEKKGKTSQLKLCFGPLISLEVLGSIGLIALMTTSLGVYGFCTIPVIWAANWTYQKVGKHSKSFEEKIKEKHRGNTSQKEHLKRQNKKYLLSSGLTSWVTHNLNPNAQAEQQVVISAFPIIVFLVASFTSLVVSDNEEHLDLLMTMTFRVLVAIVVIKLASCMILSILSDFRNQRKIRCLQIDDSISIIEYPEDYRKDSNLTNSLLRNINIVNQQHPYSGQTIMHVIDKLEVSVENIIQLYKNGAKVDIKDYEGQTPVEKWSYKTQKKFKDGIEGNQLSEIIKTTKSGLMVFLENDHPKLFSIFIHMGFNLEVKDNQGKNIMDHLAQKNVEDGKENVFLSFLKPLNDLQVIEVMVKKTIYGKQNNGNSEQQITRLLISIYNYKKENHGGMLCMRDQSRSFFQLENDNQIRDLLQEMWDIDYGQTNIKEINQLLNFACKDGKENLAKHLLDCKFDPNFQDGQGETPLHYASFNGHLNCINLLLDFKARLDITSNNGDTPLHKACQNGHANCWGRLKKTSDDLNVQNKQGWTPLHSLLEHHHNADFVRSLLKLGAERNVGNEDGETPLHFACKQERSSESVRALLGKAANLNTKNTVGRTPLHQACEKGNSNVVSELLEAGCDPHATDMNGRTPLHEACWEGQAESVRLLLAKEAHPNVQGKDGETPLHLACRKGHYDCIKALLMDSGVDIMIVNGHGKTPLDLAREEAPQHPDQTLKREEFERCIRKIDSLSKNQTQADKNITRTSDELRDPKSNDSKEPRTYDDETQESSQLVAGAGNFDAIERAPIVKTSTLDELRDPKSNDSEEHQEEDSLLGENSIGVAKSTRRNESTSDPRQTVESRKCDDDDDGTAGCCCGKHKDLCFWRHPKVKHVGTCLLFFIFKVCLMLFDVASDLYTGYNHIQNEDRIWGCLTFLVTLFPFLFTSLKYLLNKCRGQNSETSIQDNGLVHLPLVQICRNLRIFFGLATMNSSNPHNLLLVSILNQEAGKISILEAFLESAPQLVLQFYIILTNGNPSVIQIISIVLSFCSLCYASMSLFFSGRIGKEKDELPKKRLLLAVAPLAAIDLLCSLILVSILAALTKGWGLIIAATAIIGIHLLYIYATGFSERLKKELQKELKGGIAQLERLFKEIPEALNSAALTSWIVNTVVVKSTKSLQLMFSLISIIIYLASLLISITLQYEKAKVQDYSVLICSPKELKPGWANEENIFFGTAQAFSINEKFVRICKEGENPTDVLFKIIVPLLCTAACLKVFAGYFLSLLSDTKTLMKGLNWLCSCFCTCTCIFHYIDVIEDPAKYRGEKLLKLLSSNIDLVNRQHPLDGRTILHVAEDLKLSIDDIQKLYKKGANVEIRDFNGKSAKECWNETDQSAFEQFLQSQADEENQLEAKREECCGPCLLKYLEQRKLEKFSRFIWLGAKTNSKDHSGKSILEHLAIEILENEKIDEFLKLLKFLKYLSYEDILEIMIQMKIHHSNKANNEEMDPDIIERLVSIYNNQHKIIKEKRLTDKFKTKGKRSRGFFKLEDGSDIIKEMWQINFGKNVFKHINQLLNFACKDGKEKLAQHLLDCKFDPNFQDDQGESALHYASSNGHSGCATLLLRLGANRSLKNKNGDIPLHKACRSGNLETANKLVKEADLNVQNKQGWTPLHTASDQWFDSDSVNILLEAGADPNIRNNNGDTPLHLACKAGRHSECAKALLDKDHDLNLKNKYGQTPLHRACEQGNPNCVDLLLKAGCDPNCKDKYGRTPLHFACWEGQLDCVSHLLASKGDPNVQDRNGDTPLHVACQRGHSDSLELLLDKNGDCNIKNVMGKTSKDLAEIEKVRKTCGEWKKKYFEKCIELINLTPPFQNCK